jgi:hypothetical protein
MADKITFIASFPAIQSAIAVGDDGMRIQLQIPESEMERALWLITMRDKPLRVTIEAADGDGDGITPTSRRSAKRRK